MFEINVGVIGLSRKVYGTLRSCSLEGLNMFSCALLMHLHAGLQVTLASQDWLPPLSLSPNTSHFPLSPLATFIATSYYTRTSYKALAGMSTSTYCGWDACCWRAANCARSCDRRARASTLRCCSAARRDLGMLVGKPCTTRQHCQSPAALPRPKSHSSRTASIPRDTHVVCEVWDHPEHAACTLCTDLRIGAALKERGSMSQ